MNIPNGVGSTPQGEPARRPGPGSLEWADAQLSRAPEPVAPASAASSAGAEGGAETAPSFTLAADVVLFGQSWGVLCVLLIERGWPPFKGCWALPGGLIEQDETFEAAARRELTESTGLVAPDLMEHGGVWDDPGRDPRGRVISVAYVGLVKGLPRPNAGDDARAASWVLVQEVLDGTGRGHGLASTTNGSLPGRTGRAGWTGGGRNHDRQSGGSRGRPGSRCRERLNRPLGI